MSFNLWWAQNDGIGGHVWLGVDEVLALGREMRAQGMAWERDGTGTRAGIPLSQLAPKAGNGRISAVEVDQALAAASPEPLTPVDRRLWQDWLLFLEGAAQHGGILVG